jgi:hypothetical protein
MFYSGLPYAEAAIYCWGDKFYIGVLEFHKDNEPLPQNKINDYDHTLTLYYPISRFNDVVNILRYEKPLYFLMITHSLGGALMTGDADPVGEQEP